MDRAKFEEEFHKALPQVDKRRYKKDIRIMHRKNIDDPNYPDDIQLVVAIEELSELQKELTKYLRGRRDPIGVIEETADVAIIIGYIMEICGISVNDIYKAMNVKLDRIERVIKGTNHD